MSTRATRIGCLVGVFLLVSAATSPLSAQTGTLLAGPFFAPSVFGGNGRGIAFDGVNLYLTRVTGDINGATGDPIIYKITPPLPSGPVVTISVPSGDPRVSNAGPLAWDGSALWTLDYLSQVRILYRVDPASGATLSSCSIPNANPGHPALPLLRQNDGLHWTGIQGSELVISAEEGLGPVVFVNVANCVITSFFSFSRSGCCSGVAFDGANLWHVDIAGLISTIFQTDLNGVPTGLSFPTDLDDGTGHKTAFEDLEFDAVTFAPKCALWGHMAFPSGGVAAYEVPCVDKTPPQAACVATTTPSGSTVPPAGSKSGGNEDGYYALVGQDSGGIASIVIKDSASAFVSQAFNSGDKVKIIQAPGAAPNERRPGPGAIASQVTLKGDAILQVTDSSGNVTEVSCKVPPPPK